MDNNYNSLNKKWVHHSIILHNGLEVNLSNPSFLSNINSSEKREIVASDVANQIILFVEKFQHLFTY